MEMRVSDKGEPGANDTWMLEIKMQDGTLIYSSNFVSNKTTEVIVGGGNIQVNGTALARSMTAVAGDVAATINRDMDVALFTVKPLAVTVGPNPSVFDFTLRLSGGTNEDVTVDVINMLGHLVKRYKVTAGTNLQFGLGLTTGVYMLDIRQGATRKTMKIIKQ